MTRPHNPFAARQARIDGLIPGSLQHRILLALRPEPGMTAEQIYARFESPSTAMCLLRRAGLIITPPIGKKGEAIRLTAAGRALVDPRGKLARAESLITYCQLGA